MTTVPRLDAERAVLVTKAYHETGGEPAMIRRAEALVKILNEMTIFISDDELIKQLLLSTAGLHQGREMACAAGAPRAPGVGCPD